MTTLSVLERGSLLDRMIWIASLYDLDGDGFITREDLEDVIFSVRERFLFLTRVTISINSSS